MESLRQYVHLVPQAELETYLVYLVRTAFSPAPTTIQGLESIKLTPEEVQDEDAESRQVFCHSYFINIGSQFNQLTISNPIFPYDNYEHRKLEFN